MAGTAYETVDGGTIEIGCDGDSLTVNGIKMVLKKDIVTTNGVIHLIDQVLVPDSGTRPHTHTHTHTHTYIHTFTHTHTLPKVLQMYTFILYVRYKPGGAVNAGCVVELMWSR